MYFSFGHDQKKVWLSTGSVALIEYGKRLLSDHIQCMSEESDIITEVLSFLYENSKVKRRLLELYTTYYYIILPVFCIEFKE